MATNVRPFIKKAEADIRAAIIKALTELEAETGLRPSRIRLEMIDVTPSGKPTRIEIGDVELNFKA